LLRGRGGALDPSLDSVEQQLEAALEALRTEPSLHQLEEDVSRFALGEHGSHVRVFARRSLAHVRQMPEKLIDVTLQPLMFVLLFAFVFGGVIAVPGAATGST
jgi:hypothetical protein